MKTLAPGKQNEQLARFANRMRKMVVGQPTAIEKVTDSFSRLIAGIHDPESPLLTMMFMGPTGVGKTETVRALAEAVFGNRRAFTRINCQEYSAHYNISKLLGSPPGYVGGEIRPLLAQENIDRHHRKAIENQTGLITEPGGKLARLFPPESDRNLSIVLFDEIEKAHPKLWNLLLGVLEDGTVVLGNNEEVDFRQSIIVLTTNVGSAAMGQHLAQNTIGFDPGSSAERLDHDVEEAAMREAKKVFPFEFLNRFDEIVTFHTLKEPHLYEILDILLTQIHHRSLRCSEPFLLEVTPKAKAWLVEEGTDVQYGARPLRRLVEKEVVTQISHLICSDQIRKGDLITVDLEDSGLVFQKETGGADWDELEALGPFPQDRWAGSDLGVKDDGGEKARVKEETAHALTATGVYQD
ncbi:MAG TPA: AAA family ATPase [Candidatus Krumholzibacteria bacterium]|nr:AAA family ATPase [Candidatus Krumholzibacteria bacterium]HPD72117.1 AAA family ATPase [Candidatus Krumholzibacteria bacterium]HRY40951.1 AAA family ATPase [Candidatus Krumholzibacteria bacterium]